MDLTYVIIASFALAIAVATYILWPWLKTKVDAQKLETVKKLVKIGCQAAEQYFKGETGVGKEKKTYVIDWLRKIGVERYFTEKGIIINWDTIDAFLESSVLMLPETEE